MKREQIPQPPVQVTLPQLFTSFCVVNKRRNDLSPSTTTSKNSTTTHKQSNTIVNKPQTYKNKQDDSMSRKWNSRREQNLNLPLESHSPWSTCKSNHVLRGAIHSTKIPTGPTGKRGPPQKVDPFFQNFSGWTEPIHWVLDRDFCWMDRALGNEIKCAIPHFIF